MAPPRGPVRWLYVLGLGRPSPEDSVEAELEHHLSELTDRLVEEGWDPTSAGAEARRRLGDEKKYGPSMRRLERRRAGMERRRRLWDVLREGMASGVRVVRRYPAFAGGVILTLGLGIGANVTMYGIIDRLLLRPPEHIVEPERVRRVFIERPAPFGDGLSVGSVTTYPDYTDQRAHSGFAAVAAYTPSWERTIGSGATAARANVATASAELFGLLGVSPSVGRFYTTEEAEPGSAATAVIGYEYWERVFGSDGGVLGRSIEVDGRDHTIIGVAPLAFTGMDLTRVDVWLPLELTNAAQYDEGRCLRSRGCYWLTVVARLAEGVSIDAAEAEATSLHLAGRSEAVARGSYSDRARIVLGPLIAAEGPEASDESRVARWLAAVSLIVLLITCANVANLFLARATRLQRETDVRLALGAPRSWVVAQTMGEAVVVGLAGGVLALLLARWGGAVVRSVLLPSVLFPAGTLSVRLLAFTMLTAVAAGVMSGVGPALLRSGRDVTGRLGDGGRGASVRRSRLRSGLTVLQASLSVVLLVGAGLFVRSLDALRSVDMGLDVDHLVLASLELRDADIEPLRQNEIYEEALRRVATLGSVASVAATGVPFQWALATELHVPELDSLPRLPGGGPYFYNITPGYFETLGLAVTRGRPIGESDGPDAAKVTVVSETMARTLWPGADALGRCVRVGGRDEECTTVVGVVEDAARDGFDDELFMAYYLPATQRDNEPHEGIYVRAGADAEGIVEEVGRTLAALPEVRFADVQTMRERLDPQARSWTLGATMFTVFGLLALVVAAIGLYSVLAFDVAQRTRELGIRAALGAERGRLLRSVLFQGARFAALGIILGLAAAYLAAPYAADLLFRVSPRDAGVLTGVAATLLAVSVIASLVPGLRATQVDPVVALKSD